MLLDADCIGKPSARQIENATYDEVTFLYLQADQHPDRDTIANFRQQHRQSLAHLLLQALSLCQQAGLVKLGHIALDGTKGRAQANRHRTLWGGRISEGGQVMKDGASGALLQAGNAQAAMEGQGQIIVAAEMTTECNDKGQRVPMVGTMHGNVGALPECVLADTGQGSEEALGPEALTSLDILRGEGFGDFNSKDWKRRGRSER